MHGARQRHFPVSHQADDGIGLTRLQEPDGPDGAGNLRSLVDAIAEEDQLPRSPFAMIRGHGEQSLKFARAAVNIADCIC